MRGSLSWVHKMDFIAICVIFTTVLQCDGVSVWKQLAHIAHQKAESRRSNPRIKAQIMRRFSPPGDQSVILGAPLYSSHLPAAEPILPGHTLIRPAIGMLKSAVKFPHRDQENGAGVYGHYDNLGIRYDGKNERVLYSKFRRMLPTSLQSYNMALAPKRQKFYLRNKPRKIKGKYIQDIKNCMKMSKDRSNVRKILTIYPSKIIKMDSKYLNHQQRKKKNHLNNNKKLLQLHARAPNEYFNKMQAKKSKGTNLKDVLSMIKSLRRDQELHFEPDDDENVGQISVASFVMAHSTPQPETTEISNSSLFWDTKDSFNHIKINPEAPEHAELLPVEALDDINKQQWWFYHQADFTEFEDR